MNFHALRMLCERRGGLALFPDATQPGLKVTCCLMTPSPASFRLTRRAFKRHAAEFRPGDFYQIALHIRAQAATMSAADLLACLRLTLHDAHQFRHYLPRLQQLAPAFTTLERTAVLAAIEHVWAHYFELGENYDLAGDIAALLSAMNEPETALVFLDRSRAVPGAARQPAVRQPRHA